MNKIKVLYIIDSLNGYGAETSLVEIAKRFNNVEPVFVSIYGKESHLNKVLEDSNIPFYELKIDKRYAYRLAVNKLIPILNKEKPDIIHATLYRSEIISRKLKRKFIDIPLIGSFVSNGYSEDRYAGVSFFHKIKLYYYFLRDRFTARYTDYFISNSEAIKISNSVALNVPLRKVKVIHRGRSADKFRENTNDPTKLKKLFNSQEYGNVLLNVSRIIPLKGQIDIIRAMPLILDEFPNTILILAGEGVYQEVLNREVNNYQLKEKVYFLGRVEEVQTLLNQADVFIFPSYSEGLPGALIEAMMASIPIVASDIPENLECVNNNCAYIYPKGDFESLAKKVLNALYNKEDSLKKALIARKVAIQKFDINIIADRYESFYKSIL